jgi:outer membrane cobalamin receptor
MRPGLPFGRPGLFIPHMDTDGKEMNTVCPCSSFFVLVLHLPWKGDPMRYIAMLLMWYTLAFSQILAQNGSVLTGQIVDQASKRPVSGAQVELSGTSFRTTTGQDGTFTFPALAPGAYTVRTSRVGYTASAAEVVLRAGETRTVTFELREVAYLLDPVTSTATRMQSRASEVSSSVTVLPGTGLEEYQALDIGSAMQEVPGVFIRPYGALGDVRTASIRGSSAGQVLVLMDGQRMNSTQSGEVDLTTLPVEGIERVEIVRGGASALYGADAVGGVINVITKGRTVPEGMTANLKLMTGSFGTREAEAKGDYSSGTTFTALSYRYLKSEGDFTYHPASGVSARRVNADFLSHSLFGKERWSIDDRRTLSLTGQYFTNTSGDPGTIAFPNTQARKQNRNVLLDMAYDEDHEGVVRNFRIQSYYHNLLFNYEDPLAWVPILNNSHNVALGGETQTVLRFNDWNSLTAGYAYRWDHFSGTSLPGEYQRGLHSAYLVDELALRPAFLKGVQRIAILPALRWDRFSDFGAQLSPKVGLVVNAGDGWLLSVKANYGRSFRAPTFNDLYWPADSYTAGNPNLKPERATDFDAGATLELPVLAGVGASLTWFGNSITDLILWAPGADWVWRPANVGKAEVHGIESGFFVSPWKDLLTLSWNYTRLNARSKSGSIDEYDKRLPDRPGDMHKVTLRTRYGGLSAIVDFLSVGLRYTTASNSTFLPSHRVFNIVVGYAWEMSKSTMEVKGEVGNVGDVDYQVMSGYPVPGREVRVSLSYNVGAVFGR